MTDVLTAIDDALETGIAAAEDPHTRELQELALALRADAPEPTREFRESMDRRVARGFARTPRARRPLWRRSLQPAAAAALVFVIAAPLAFLVDVDGGGGDDDAGGSALVGAGGGGGGGGERVLERSSGRAVADSAAPGMVLPPQGRNFAPGRSDRRIERSVGLELETPVDEMARVAERVTAVTNRHGGFVLSSSLSTGEESAGGDFELRIPSLRLRPALRDLAALADVRTQTQTGRDVTREHVTATDRLQAARAERRSLLRRLENAATDEEAEALRVRLDLAAGEINGLRARLRDLRLRTDYAVVTVALLPKGGEDAGGSGAGGSLDDAFGDAGDLLVGVAGVIIRILAVLLPIGLVALLAWPAARALRRRRRESALA
jgi:hypothetical protein